MKSDINTIILIIFSIKHIIFITTGLLICRFNMDPLLLLPLTVIYIIILYGFTFITKKNR